MFSRSGWLASLHAHFHLCSPNTRNTSKTDTLSLSRVQPFLSWQTLGKRRNDLQRKFYNLMFPFGCLIEIGNAQTRQPSGLLSASLAASFAGPSLWPMFVRATLGTCRAKLSANSPILAPLQSATSKCPAQASHQTTRLCCSHLSPLGSAPFNRSLILPALQ